MWTLGPHLNCYSFIPLFRLVHLRAYVGQAGLEHLILLTPPPKNRALSVHEVKVQVGVTEHAFEAMKRKKQLRFQFLQWYTPAMLVLRRWRQGHDEFQESMGRAQNLEDGGHGSGVGYLPALPGSCISKEKVENTNAAQLQVCVTPDKWSASLILHFSVLETDVS